MKLEILLNGEVINVKLLLMPSFALPFVLLSGLIGEGIGSNFAQLSQTPRETILFMLLVNLFRDDCINELDLNRFRDFLFSEFEVVVVNNTTNANNTNNTYNTNSTNTSVSNVLFEIVMRGAEGNEQDLEAFDSNLLKPLQSLPPGRLPGINFDSEAAQRIPSSIFSTTTNTNTNSSIGNSPKRRKLEQQNQQNFTIQHF